MFKDKTTGELLVLIVGLTVCGYVIVSILLIIAVVFFVPERDVSDAVRNISDVINTLIGLLAGFLAGRTDASLIKRDLERGQDRKINPEDTL